LIVERFIDAAAEHADRPALATPTGAVSYGELAGDVQRIARRLRQRFGPGAIVALHAHKSAGAITAMLACALAGVPYVPIDPAFPDVRRRFIAADAGAVGVVLDASTGPAWGLDDIDGVAVAAVSDRGTAIEPEPLQPTRPTPDGGPFLPPVAPDSLAYVLYTSGSTGAPKGVMITHANADAFVEWACDAFDVGPGDRVAVHAGLHFDLPVFDIYVTLAKGGTVVPVPEPVALFPEALRRFLAEERVTVLYAVPSALVSLLERSALAESPLTDLRLLLYAGEEFPPGVLLRLMQLQPWTAVHNLYGPVETNVVTSMPVAAEALPRRVPIGRPVSGATILLLAVDGEDVGVPGEAGEIAVFGPSVSPGYLGRPELTAASRVTRKVGDVERTGYRTGDFAAWDTEVGGVLQFHGRRDDMVKTRGHRVEMAEVELALGRHPEVERAVVVAVPSQGNTNDLHGFVVPLPGAATTENGLRRWCGEQLPRYMVPVRVHIVPELPATNTGKVDRLALRRRAAEEAEA
jgi:L-proline---[L-prolyl-carrier protein] ligase